MIPPPARPGVTFNQTAVITCETVLLMDKTVIQTPSLNVKRTVQCSLIQKKVDAVLSRENVFAADAHLLFYYLMRFCVKCV